MTSQLSTKLRELATYAHTHADALVQEYGPKLDAAAEDVSHKLEAWTNAVDHWVETHFEPEAEKLRGEAGAAYRLATTKAHELMDEAKAKFFA